MAANSAVPCPHRPLEGLVVGSGASSRTVTAARKDALHGAAIEVKEGFQRHDQTSWVPSGKRHFCAAFTAEPSLRSSS